MKNFEISGILIDPEDPSLGARLGPARKTPARAQTSKTAVKNSRTLRTRHKNTQEREKNQTSAQNFRKETSWGPTGSRKDSEGRQKHPTPTEEAEREKAKRKRRNGGPRQRTGGETTRNNRRRERKEKERKSHQKKGQGTQLRVRGRPSNHAKNTGTLPETEGYHNVMKTMRREQVLFLSYLVRHKSIP